jgi:hypothetical protein
MTSFRLAVGAGSLGCMASGSGLGGIGLRLVPF